MIILDSISEETLIAILPVKFALICPGKIEADGLWVAKIIEIPAALPF
jgi:hypothetical protein